MTLWTAFEKYLYSEGILVGPGVHHPRTNREAIETADRTEASPGNIVEMCTRTFRATRRTAARIDRLREKYDDDAFSEVRNEPTASAHTIQNA